MNTGIVEDILGAGQNLMWYQMAARGFLLFWLSLALIRIAGRRTFGQKTPFDNIIAITLGALMARAIVGSSALGPVAVTSLMIVLLHRLLGWIVSQNMRWSQVFEGRKIILFSAGKFQRDQMRRGLVCEEDIREGIRKASQTEDLSRIARVYLEPNGEIGVVEK